MSEPIHGKGALAIGGLAAILASTCCLGPLVLVALGYLGRTEEAKLAARRMLELTPELTVSRMQSVSPYKDPALRKRAAAIYRAAGVPG